MDPQKSRQNPKTGKKRKVRRHSKKGMLPKLRTLVGRVNFLYIIMAVILAYIVGKIILRYAE